MQPPNPEPKKLTPEEREKSIDEFCAEVNRILGRQPPTQEEIDQAVAESNTLDTIRFTQPKISEPKLLTMEERSAAIEKLCEELRKEQGRPPPTQEDLDRAIAESHTLGTIRS